jgi:hypothetical protein
VLVVNTVLSQTSVNELSYYSEAACSEFRSDFAK